jgi:hypothetical protein
VQADVDDSNRVDFGDFSFFASAFGRSVGEPEPPYAAWADFDGSGRVDFGDFALFAVEFGRSRGGSLAPQAQAGAVSLDTQAAGGSTDFQSVRSAVGRIGNPPYVQDVAIDRGDKLSAIGDTPDAVSLALAQDEVIEKSLILDVAAQPATRLGQLLPDQLLFPAGMLSENVTKPSSGGDRETTWPSVTLSASLFEKPAEGSRIGSSAITAAIDSLLDSGELSGDLQLEDLVDSALRT